MKNKLLIILLLTFVSISCAKEFPKANLVIKTPTEEKHLIVELAKTPEQREQGFMNRKKIPEGTGMLFIFEKDQVLSFWMKNTHVSLSIAYIDKSGVIVDILDMTPLSLKSVTSSQSVRYALEVPKNWFTNNNIKVGDTVVITENIKVF